jgi:spore germination cell wall hydrolase CwlJ-like protein
MEAAFTAGRPTPSPQSIAYRPSQAALAFKSAGESQAEFEERERRCLSTAIYFEARGEPVRGQIAVAQVILNRVRSPQFPQTICGVVYQGQMQKGCQFSFACDGHTDMPRDNDQWALAQDIAKQATSGQVWLPEVGYSTYYHANYVRPGWVNNMNKIDKIGNHIFYKKRNEQPYVVEASAQQASSTATDATPAVSLVSSSAAPTPATNLTFAPNE